MSIRHLVIAVGVGGTLGCNVISRDLLGQNPAADAPVAIDGALPIDAPPDPTMVVYYAFEGASTVVADGSSRNLDGTLSDVAAWTAGGRYGRAIKMSGAIPPTQYVSLPDGILAGVDNFTISAWVRLDASTAWARVYDIGNGLADPANRFMYLTTNGYTLAGVPDGIHSSMYGGAAANESVTSTSTLLPVGVWKHLTFTGSGAEHYLYVDGFPAAHITTGPAWAPHEAEPLAPNSWIGRSRFAADPGFNGTIDEFRVYSRVLGQSEIADLAWPQHDYSYWRFDETSGTHAKDSSDNAIATTLDSGPTWTTGRIGGAVDLAGGSGATGPHLTLASSPFANCTTQFTVAAWVKLRALTPWSRIFDFGSGTTSFMYLAPTDGTGMHFAMVSPAGLFDMVTPTQPAFDDHAWHHVAVTVDPQTLVTLYVDGVSVMTATSTAVKPSDFTAVTDNWLGKSRFSDPYLNGSIDELRIACRAYTQDEITNLSRP